MERLVDELHDGAVKLYTRDGAKKPTIHYQIRIPGTSEYERKTTKTTNRDEALKFVQQRYQEILWRSNNKMAIRGITFRDAAKHYEVQVSKRAQEGELSPKSAKERLARLNRYLIPFLGDMLLSEIDQKVIDRFHEWMLALYEQDIQKAKKLGPIVEVPSTVQRTKRTYTQNGKMHTLIAFRGVRGVAIDRNLVSERELPIVKSEKPAAKRRGTLTPEQYKELVAYLASKQRFWKWHARHHHQRMIAKNMVIVLACSGCRLGEIKNLKWRDIREFTHKEKQYCELSVDGKTGPRTVVPLPEILGAFREIRKYHPDPKPNNLVFVKHSGKPQRHWETGLNAALRDMEAKTDEQGQNITLYSLRHYYITQRLLRGTDIHLLSRNAGTSIHHIEHTYSHVVPRMKVDELTK